MLLKLVNPENKDELCLYGEICDFRISTRGGTPANIDEFMEEQMEKQKDTIDMTDQFINEKSKKPIIRIFFKLWHTDERYEVFTNWKIYLMDNYGETIESL